MKMILAYRADDSQPWKCLRDIHGTPVIIDQPEAPTTFAFIPTTAISNASSAIDIEVEWQSIIGSDWS